MATSILAGVLLVLQASGRTSAQTTMLALDGNGNGILDTWVVDDDGDGLFDRVLVDGNEDRTAEIVIYAPGERLAQLQIDQNVDHVMDTVIVPWVGANGAVYSSTLWRDTDQNGRWENAYHDGENDGYHEWVYVDTNFDGSADTWAASAAPRGRTAADLVNDQLTSTMAANSARSLGLDFPYIGGWSTGPLP